MRNLEKSSNQRYAFEVRIRKNISGRQVLVMRGVPKSTENKFAHHGEAGAGSSNWLASGDVRVDCILHRGAFPQADVVGLVAAGNENDRCATNHLHDRGILCCLLIRNDEGGHGVEFAQAVEVGVVGVASTGTQNQEIPAVALVAKPAKRFVEIAATAHQGSARSGSRLAVTGVSDADVLIGTGMSRAGCQPQG